jgi:hypothetical protein
MNYPDWQILVGFLITGIGKEKWDKQYGVFLSIVGVLVKIIEITN